MKKRRIKRKGIIIILTILLCTILTICLYKFIQYRKSDNYKLKQKGYTEEEIILFEKKLTNKDIILTQKYNKNISKFINQKYFIEKNLKEYLKYLEEDPTKKTKEIITIINTGIHKETYENIKKADISKKEQILVNKYYYLEENFPNEEELITVASKYAYANIKIRKEIYSHYQKMWESAKEDGITLIITSGYRSYEKQKKAYNSYSDTRGESYADKVAAHPGFSETQTGLAINLTAKGTTKADFANSDAYKWLQENAADYGFILRYPKEKENITLFKFEPCHYRYVGKKIAKQIKKENITFEEYYAYYLK